MALKGKPLKPSTFSRVLVCVDKIEDHEIWGRLYTVVNPDGVKFNGMVALCTELDNMFDTYDFPQPTHVHRSFREKERKQNIDGEKAVEYMQLHNLDEHGEKATFVIHVQFRQNASWQGTIQWVDGKKTQRFRSTLEMIKLISDAFPSEEEEEFVSWED